MLSLRFEMKRRILFACFDLLSLGGAWFGTLHLRLLLNSWFPVQFTWEGLVTAAPPFPAILLMWVGIALLLRLYGKDSGVKVWRSLGSAIEGVLVLSSLVVLQTVVFRDLGAAQSRSFVLAFVPLSALHMALGRYAAWVLAGLIDRRWGTGERIAMIGRIEETVKAYRTMRSGEGTLQLQFAGVILPEGEEGRDTGTHSMRILGFTNRLAELINCERLDRIIVMPERIPEHELAACAQTSRRMGVTMSRVIAPAEPDSRAEFSAFSGLHLLDLRPVYFTRKQEIAKRVFDGAVALFSLIALSPVLLFFAALVKATSPGPVLYRSLRVGRGGRHFMFYKFRSMYNAADRRRAELASRNEHSGHVFKVKDDPRVTRLGRFMRRYSIDELPQLINVLIGNMSLVGPRPLPASDLAPDGQSPHFSLWAEQRSRVLPGITGLWQVRGRSDLPFDQLMEFDTYYIRNWSLKLDIEILLQTPLVVMLGRGAY
jgi:exopolysaccharide biosynthesis polyprenyl glycosylphosphotransferase